MANSTAVVILDGNSSAKTVSTIDAMLTAPSATGQSPGQNVLTVQPSTGGFLVTSLASGTVIVSSLAGGTITSLTSGTVNITGGTLTSLTSGTVNISGGAVFTAAGSPSANALTVQQSTHGFTITSSSGGNILTVDAFGSGKVTVADATGTAVGFNTNGQAAMAASAPVTIASNQTTLGVSQDTSLMVNGATGTTVTPTFALITASASGATAVVSASTTKKIRVLQWIVTVNAAVNFKWQSGSSDKTGLFYAGAQGGGAGGAFNPVGHFQTNTNEDLNINLSGAVAVGGALVYITV